MRKNAINIDSKYQKFNNLSFTITKLKIENEDLDEFSLSLQTIRLSRNLHGTDIFLHRHCWRL